MDQSVATEILLEPVCCHRDLSWTNQLPQRSYLDQSVTTEILLGPVSCHRDLTWTSQLPQRSYLDQSVATEILVGPVSCHRDLTWTRQLPQRSYLDRSVATEILPRIVKHFETCKAVSVSLLSTLPNICRNVLPRSYFLHANNVLFRDALMI